MKRFFCVFLVLLVVFASLPIYASAAEFDPVQSEYQSLFSLMESQQRDFYSSSNTISIPISLGEETFLYIGFADLFVYTPYTLLSVTIADQPGVLTNIGGEYTVTSYVNRSLTGTFYINFTFAETNVSLSLMSAEYTSNIQSVFSVPSNITFIQSGLTQDYTYDGSPLNISRIDDTYSRNEFEIKFITSNPRFYDYLNISMFLNVNAISSIVAGFADTYVVPVSISYLDNSGHAFDNNYHLNLNYYVKISIDLRSVDWSRVTAPLTIRLSGFYDDASSANIVASINGIKGFIFIPTEDPVIFWFRKTYANLGHWFNTLDFRISSVGTQLETWGQNIVDSIDAVRDVIIGEENTDTTISDAIENQEQVNHEVNLQLQSAVGSWSDNVGVVTQGFNLALTNATPALIWISGMAQNVFSGMGWFGNIFFFLGFLHVFFLLMSKSGLGRAIDRSDKRGDD